MNDQERQDPATGAARIKRWLRPLMLAATAVFVALTAWDLSRRWENKALDVDWLQLTLSLLPVLAGAFIQGIGWILLVERMARTTTPRWPALRLYFESQLARYTPGKVGLPLVRMEGAPAIGLTRRVVGLSVLLEMLSWTATGAALGFLLLRVVGAPEDGVAGLAGKLATPLLAASLALALALVAVDRRHFPEKLRNALGIDGQGPLVPLRLPLLQLAYWGTWALHGYFLARAFGASSADALLTMGFSPLANVLGFVALAAPAGVGVREAVLLAGLSPILGGPAALGAAVLSRIVSLLADITTWLLARTKR
jgi:uncharacterized membrane protein YbhN (UPF0104 family)